MLHLLVLPWVSEWKTGGRGFLQFWVRFSPFSSGVLLLSCRHLFSQLIILSFRSF
uniref:Uncharacterized protein n=1 Tax=Manihot esculenta TaxID=3983 RepID=A0A2C9UBJ9_MANES